MSIDGLSVRGNSPLRHTYAYYLNTTDENNHCGGW